MELHVESLLTEAYAFKIQSPLHRLPVSEPAFSAARLLFVKSCPAIGRTL